MAKIKNKEYMELALELAARGFGEVEPNPMAGCVIVKDDRVIGKGWHKKFGGPHAEINALDDARKNGLDLVGGTMCVTLEPCCHHGKTGPCVEAIVEAKIAKVIVAMADPTEKVGGKGIEQLRNAGVKVSVGLCQKEAKLLNPAFIKFAKIAKPWVIVKWAQTIDGKLAWKSTDRQQRWITGEKSRKDVHKIRRSCQGILVGINTVIADDPLLTARPAKEKKLLRVVLDSDLRIPMECQLLKTIDDGPVLVVTSESAMSNNKDKVEKITAVGGEVFAAAIDESDKCNLDSLLGELGGRGVQRLLVEGGPEVIGSFLRQKLADEVCVYIAPKIFGSSGAVDISQVLSQLEIGELNYVTVNTFGEDIRIKGLLRKVDEL